MPIKIITAKEVYEDKGSFLNTTKPVLWNYQKDIAKAQILQSTGSGKWACNRLLSAAVLCVRLCHLVADQLVVEVPKKRNRRALSRRTWGIFEYEYCWRPKGLIIFMRIWLTAEGKICLTAESLKNSYAANDLDPSKTRYAAGQYDNTSGKLHSGRINCKQIPFLICRISQLSLKTTNASRICLEHERSYNISFLFKMKMRRVKLPTIKIGTRKTFLRI